MNKLTQSNEFETATDRVKAMIIRDADTDYSVEVESEIAAYDIPALFDVTIGGTYQGGEPNGKCVSAEMVGINLAGLACTRTELVEWPAFGKSWVEKWELAASEQATEEMLS